MKLRYALPAAALAIGIPVAGVVYAQSSPGQKLACTVLTSTPDRLGLDCVPEVPPSTTTAPTSTSSTTTATTTTAPATTTTAPASTTTAPPPSTSPTSTSTTSPPTSTTQPPTTTTQPPGVVFSEDFTSPDAFATRFVKDVGDYVDGTHQHHTDYLIDCCPWVDTNANTMGDHAGPDPMCGVPETTRTLSNASPGDRSQYFWQCGPTGPASSHLMTAFDSTGYNVVSFSPNQTFSNVTKVCWSVNATEEGGGKWTNMIIVPIALYNQFAPRMDYVRFDFNSQNAPGDFNIQQADHPTTRFLGVTDFRGTQFVYNGDQLLAHPGGDVSQTTTDKRARYRHCMEKTSSTTARLSVARPSGATDVYNVSTGAAWPTGQVRVIFQDEMYDPPKREGYNPNNVTWHWDDLQVTAG